LSRKQSRGLVGSALSGVDVIEVAVAGEKDRLAKLRKRAVGAHTLRNCQDHYPSIESIKRA